MLLSLTLLKGTDTKITQLYLADAALAIGQRRRYLLQRLAAYFVIIKTEPPLDSEAPVATRSLREVCFHSRGAWVSWGNVGTTRSRLSAVLVNWIKQQPKQLQAVLQQSYIMRYKVIKQGNHYLICRQQI